MKNSESGRERGREADRQSEVVFMLAVNSQGKVLVAGLRETVLFVQNVQDSHQLCFHQVWKQQLYLNQRSCSSSALQCTGRCQKVKS